MTGHAFFATQSTESGLGQIIDPTFASLRLCVPPSGAPAEHGTARRQKDLFAPFASTLRGFAVPLEHECAMRTNARAA